MTAIEALHALHLNLIGDPAEHGTDATIDDVIAAAREAGLGRTSANNLYWTLRHLDYGLDCDLDDDILSRLRPLMTA